jgi:hypothetical protein
VTEFDAFSDGYSRAVEEAVSFFGHPLGAQYVVIGENT